jgi:hypothetical protein
MDDIGTPLDTQADEVEVEEEQQKRLDEDIDCLSRAAAATEGPPGAPDRPRWIKGLPWKLQPSYDGTKMVRKPKKPEAKQQGDTQADEEQTEQTEEDTQASSTSRPQTGDVIVIRGEVIVLKATDVTAARLEIAAMISDEEPELEGAPATQFGAPSDAESTSTGRPQPLGDDAQPLDSQLINVPSTSGTPSRSGDSTSVEAVYYNVMYYQLSCTIMYY